jgi:hypothetical protein
MQSVPATFAKSWLLSWLKPDIMLVGNTLHYTKLSKWPQLPAPIFLMQHQKNHQR